MLNKDILSFFLLSFRYNKEKLINKNNVDIDHHHVLLMLLSFARIALTQISFTSVYANK